MKSFFLQTRPLSGPVPGRSSQQGTHTLCSPGNSRRNCRPADDHSRLKMIFAYKLTSKYHSHTYRNSCGESAPADLRRRICRICRNPPISAGICRFKKRICMYSQSPRPALKLYSNTYLLGIAESCQVQAEVRYRLHLLQPIEKCCRYRLHGCGSSAHSNVLSLQAAPSSSHSKVPSLRPTLSLLWTENRTV